MQSIDQAIGPLAPSEIEVDKGYVGGMIGDQALGLGRGRDWSVHIRSPGPKQVLQGYADVPRVLDQEDTQALQIRGFGSGRVVSVG